MNNRVLRNMGKLYINKMRELLFKLKRILILIFV